MEHRAYSVLTLKAVTSRPDVVVVEGIASTPTTDRMGDIVEPMGAKFKLPMPLFLHHDSALPVGNVVHAQATASGITFRAELPIVKDAGKVKDRVDEAIHSLRHRLMGAVSIGFSGIKGAVDRMKDGGLRFKEWEWLELSLVTIPANPDAVITGVKSIDDQLRAAPGRTQHGRAPPGVPGINQQPAASGFFYVRNTKETTMKTLNELNEARELKAARIGELSQAWQAESRDPTEDEAAEFDALEAECKALDTQIRVAKAGAMARPVVGSDFKSGAYSRGRSPNIIVRSNDPDDKFQGQSFVRRVIAKALANMHQSTADRIAEARWGKSNPQLVQWIKADVAGGGSGSGEWGAELVSADNRFTGDFIEFLHGMTVYDRLPLRSVPANVAIKGQDGAATGYWVGESKAIGATKADFSTVSLTPLKVAAIAVLSNELMRDSSPSAEMLVRDALAEAISQRVDTTFLSTTAASAGVSPAGLLNGITANASGGATADDLREDLAGLISYFAGQKNTSGLQLVTTPTLAIQMMLLRNALGQREFPGVTMNGGELEGLPVMVGDNVGAGDLIMLKPSDIWKIGDGGVQVSISREATIEQDSAPQGATDTPVTMSTKFTSMFQEESTAIKIVRSINFQKRRAKAVAYIGNAAYGTVTTISD